MLSRGEQMLLPHKLAHQPLKPLHAAHRSTDQDLVWALRALHKWSGAEFVLLLAWRGRTAQVIAHSGLSDAEIPPMMKDIMQRPFARWSDQAGEEEEWLQDSGRSAQVCNFRKGEKRITAVIGFRTPPKPSISRRASVASQFLLPIVMEFMEIQRRLLNEQRRCCDLSQALDRLSVGVFLLSSSREILFSNRAAKRLSQQHDGIRISGNSVSAVSLKDAIRLQVGIDHVAAYNANPSSGDNQRGFLGLAISRKESARPLVVNIVSANAPARLPTDPAVIMFISDSDADFSAASAPVCKLFGLSPVESKVVCHLVGGKTLLETADILHIKPQTIRAYLKQIFAKTDTNRQSDLVRLVITSLIPVDDRSDIDIVA